jgi:hypothetical protein
MKHHRLGAFLVTLLFVSASFTAAMAWWHHISVKQLYAAQVNQLALANTMNAVKALAAELMDYSRRNPAIDPILQQFEIKPRAAAPEASAQPASRPAR